MELETLHELVNFICHMTQTTRYADELELIRKYEPPIVITSHGHPGEVVEIVHQYGGLVYTDVAATQLMGALCLSLHTILSMINQGIAPSKLKSKDEWISPKWWTQKHGVIFGLQVRKLQHLRSGKRQSRS
ncbi:nitronate monooxygenase family protein [Sporosarcina obsidiansis]|uniref:hypothetical protein n=1 Tax=Sporosarcina obsidiansis TaxID=2660748 RepID=UPI00129A299D|nr:hypothetical protein [Sporosarcina obsidiansis]